MRHLKKSLQFSLSAFAIFGFALVTTSYFGRLWWGFDLLSHFRVYYLIGFWVLAMVLLGARLFRVAAVSVLFCAIQLFAILPYYIPQVQSVAQERVKTDKIIFANVHYNHKDPEQIAQFLDKHQPDLVLFAEMTPELFAQLRGKIEEEYPYNFYKNGKQSFDLAIFTKTKPTNQVRVHYFGKNNVPALELQTTQNDKVLSVILSHPYSPLTGNSQNARNSELRATAEYIADKNDPTILIGDLNTTSWSPIFHDMLTIADLNDSREGEGILSSWNSSLPPVMRIPIDHALVSDEIMVHNREVLESIGSDHLPILIEVSVK